VDARLCRNIQSIGIRKESKVRKKIIAFALPLRLLRNLRTALEALNNRYPPSLRALKPLAARPKAVAGSNPVLCFSVHFWIAASLRSPQ
jgi:hypothetical protein